jgi:hypothetical protein
MAVWNTLRPGTFGEMSLRGIGNWLWFGLGFALLGWVLYEILRPRVKRDWWVSLKTGATSGGEYSFLSTHPSYVFVDLIIVTVTGFLFWVSRSNGFMTDNLPIMFAVSLIFPCLRLFSWYGLGLRVRGAETKGAWKPVAFFAVPVFAVFALIGVMTAFSIKQREREIANLPVVDAETFANSRETFNRMVGSEKKETDFVRLRARQVSEEAARCRNNQNYEFASVLADLGAGGDVLIVGSKYVGAGFNELVSKSGGNKDKMIEVIGKLREMPPASTIDSWKAYCALEKLPPKPTGGRWVLEMHEP